MKRVVERVLVADHRLGPVYLSKVDLEDMYMHLWVRVKDTPATAFIILKKKE